MNLPGAPLSEAAKNGIRHRRNRAACDLMTQIELRCEIDRALTHALQAFHLGDYEYAMEYAQLAADLFKKVGVMPDPADATKPLEVAK